MEFQEVIASDVSRYFGRRRALSHVSLSVRAGDILGLLGPNGAGKSTLLAILATLLKPSAGTVRYGAHDPATAGSDLRRGVGLLGHDLYLYPELTARENLTFFGHLYGLGRVASRVESGIESAGLAGRADEPITGFSRGMRQRLALERALLHEPRLVLLDEPFTGLDDVSGAALVTRLRAIAARGALVIVATHDLDVVDDLVTRAVVLQNGQLRQISEGVGSLREQYRKAVAS